MPSATDFAGWLDSWDRQQEGYLGNREERFAVMLGAVAEVVGAKDDPVVLDLCCGPGSIGARVLDRWPGAHVVGIDADPVLQLLGRRGSTAGPRITWITRDLTDPAWVDEVRAALGGPADAALSTTALHWLSDETLRSTYAGVAELLAPHGVVLNGDHLYEPPGAGRLRDLQRALRVIIPDQIEYGAWWEQLRSAADAEPDSELAGAFGMRPSIGSGHPDTEDRSLLAAHVDALTAAGFDQVGTVWQRGDDRVLVGLRSPSA